jgi:hypothetical protein
MSVTKQEAGQSTVAYHVNGPTLAFGRRHVDAKKAVIFENGPARSALQINLPVQPGIVPLIFVDHLAFLGGARQSVGEWLARAWAERWTQVVGRPWSQTNSAA